MKHTLIVLVTATFANFTLACATGPESQTSTSATETDGTSETGDELVPCEDRDQAACHGYVDANNELGASCTWTSLIPLTDLGNSCAMDSPVGRCMPISPVLDGCSPPPELECTLGDTTQYGTGAVIEIDGQVYLLDGSFDCWPPSPMTPCDGSDTEPGCECACDLVLGG